MSHPFATGSGNTNIPYPLTVTPQSDCGNYSNNNNKISVNYTVNVGGQYPPGPPELPPYSSLRETSNSGVEEESKQRGAKTTPRSECVSASPSAATASVPRQDTHTRSRGPPSIHFIEDPNVQERDPDEYVPAGTMSGDQLCSCKMLMHGYIKLPPDTKKHVNYFMNTKLSQADQDLEALVYFWAPTLYARQPLPFSRDMGVTCIGDIGIFTGNAGRLKTQFNIFLSKEENRRKGYNPPDGFIPYANELREKYLEEEDRQMSKPLFAVAGKWEKRRTPTAAQKADHVVFSLDSPAFRTSVGSALILPDGFTRIKLSDTRSQSVLQYIQEQGKSWYDDRKPPNALESGSLVVVAGCFVAPTWAVAAYDSAIASRTYADLKRERPGVDLYTWHSKNVFCATGPGRSDLRNGEAVNNQCIAIEAYAIRLKRKGIGISKLSVGSRLSRVWSTDTVTPK